MQFDFKVELINSFLQLGKSMVLGLPLWLSRSWSRRGVVFGALVFSLSRNPNEEARLFKYAC